MRVDDNANAKEERASLSLPDFLCDGSKAPPIYYVDTSHLNINDFSDQAAVCRSLREALSRAWPHSIEGQVLAKIHTGESKSETSMRPAYVAASADFARNQGASSVVAGDTTVAYTGPRGHKKNPRKNADAYLELADSRGWCREGPAGMPFVVLDRPCTAVPGEFEFQRRRKVLKLEGVERFDDFFLSGGFAAADMTINHAHLTLHGLAGVAGCVKSMAMGCSALRGKLRMHKSLLPVFDPERCITCGSCVDNCPQGALELDEDDETPEVTPEICIGCGECEAVCAAIREAVHLENKEVTDWERGRDTLPLRMADYTAGLMQGRWHKVLHVLHMYDVTERCDCLNVEQEPMIDRSLGFLVGTNPFAIDRLGGKMLAEALDKSDIETDEWMLSTARTSADYAAETYGILPETDLQTISLSRS